MTDTLVEPTPPVAAIPPAESERDVTNSPGSWGAAGAAPTRFYMTSDLRAATGLTRTHLDFYLREGLVRPTARAESGYLLFDEAELATLRTLLRWRHEGIGLKQIRERLGR